MGVFVEAAAAKADQRLRTIEASGGRWVVVKGFSEDEHNEVNCGEQVSTGRERASATTFWAPDRWRRSVVNSEINDKCLVCLGERSAADLIAPQSGL